VRVLTYNIRACIGSDGRRSPARVLEVIAATAADVVVLQEVAAFLHEGKPAAEWFADQLHLELVVGSTMTRHGADYGNAILSRLPVVERHWHDLTCPRREPRGALDLVLANGEHRVRIIGTHLGLRRRERAIQIDRLCAVLDDRRDASGMTILAGDLNEWRPDHSSLCRLHERLGRPPAHRTFPAPWPIWPLDRIWVHPCQALRGSLAVRNHLSRVASDHLPVIADIGSELDSQGRLDESSPVRQICGANLDSRRLPRRGERPYPAPNQSLRARH